MPKEKASQQEINEVCIEIERQGEDITIGKVVKLLGKGSYSDIAPKVLLFKEDKPLAISQASSSARVPTKKIDAIDEHSIHNLSEKIKSTLLNFSPTQIDKHVLDIRQVIEKYIKQKIKQSPNIYYPSKKLNEQEDMKEHIEHLEHQNQALISKYKSLEQKIKLLEHEKKQALAQSNEKPNSNTQSTTHTQTEESIVRQIKELKGDRRAVLSENDATIYITTRDFSPTLINELKKGKKGRHQASASYNYKSKLWELTNFNFTTVQFLYQNGFDISQHLVEYAQKLQRQQQALQKNTLK